MKNDMPRIAKVEPAGATSLRVFWCGARSSDIVELAGWIATGGDTLTPLRDASVFAQAAPAAYGSAVSWDKGDGDLAIDAVHLQKLADEQRPFTSKDCASLQAALQLSNNECADLLGVSLSTWNAYKAGDSTIPSAIAIALRAAERDPLIMQAHLRPRVRGRPKKQPMHFAEGAVVFSTRKKRS